jgi:hypothetical protein
LFLSIMFNSNTCSIKKNKYNNSPIKCLSFNQNTNFTSGLLKDYKYLNKFNIFFFFVLYYTLLNIPSTSKCSWSIRSFNTFSSSTIECIVYNKKIYISFLISINDIFFSGYEYFIQVVLFQRTHINFFN